MRPAAEKIKCWRDNPPQFVHEELHVETIDDWQLQGLKALADPAIQRIALKACVGPGKSAFEAWAGWWFQVTQGDIGQHPKGAAVSITADNLKDNLWPEFKKWQNRSEFLSSQFTWNNERIYSNHHPETWFISARSWPKKANAEEQGKTLSGLHSEYVLGLIDESGAIPVPVARAAEQALSKCKWGKIIQAGNPISLDGMLYAACTYLSKLWKVITVTGDPTDPKRSPRIDSKWATEQIEAYGRDNPWVMSQILGLFPPSSINSLLGPDEVEAAMTRVIEPAEFEFSQKRLGIDVAREGDDRTILYPRQGLRTFDCVEMRNARGPQVASRAATAKSRWNWELCMVDDTGGFGSSVVDSLQQAGLSVIPVNFSGKADDPRYFNKRAEMHFRLAEWVKRGGCLPRSPGLKRELTAPTYTFYNGKFQLEDKKLIKARLGFSPDEADALALTFAIAEMPSKPLTSRVLEERFANKRLAMVPAGMVDEGVEGKATSEWNPLDERH